MLQSTHVSYRVPPENGKLYRHFLAVANGERQDHNMPSSWPASARKHIAASLQASGAKIDEVAYRVHADGDEVFLIGSWRGHRRRPVGNALVGMLNSLHEASEESPASDVYAALARIDARRWPGEGRKGLVTSRAYRTFAASGNAAIFGIEWHPWPFMPGAETPTATCFLWDEDGNGIPARAVAFKFDDTAKAEDAIS